MRWVTFLAIWLFCFIVTAQTAQLKDNVIINGGFDLFQRNPSGATTLTGVIAYTADRFAGTAVGSATVTNSKTSPGASNATNNALLISASAGNGGTIAAGDFLTNAYAVEGYDFNKFKGKTMTLAFSVRATNTGTYCVALSNFDYTRAYIIPFTINVANTYERKVMTFKHDTSGSWNYESDVGLRIGWTWLAGSTYTTATASNTWYTPTGSQFLANASCTGNLVPNLSDNAFLSEVSLTEGSVIQPFVRAGKSVEQELSLAQRYYYKSYNLTVAPGSIDSFGASYWFSNGLAAASLALRATLDFPTAMRTNPTAAVYSNATGTAAMAACPTGDMAAGILIASHKNTAVEVIDTSGSADKRCNFHITADADYP